MRTFTCDIALPWVLLAALGLCGCESPECANNDFSRAECRVLAEWDLAHLALRAGEELRFIDPAGQDRVIDAIAGIEFRPIEVRLGRLVALPHRRRISALAFELETGRDVVAGLIADHRQALAEAVGAQVDRRSPYPHVTVARPPRRATPGLLERILHWTDTVIPPSGRVVLTDLFLYRSRPQGQRRFEALGPQPTTETFPKL